MSHSAGGRSTCRWRRACAAARSGASCLLHVLVARIPAIMAHDRCGEIIAESAAIMDVQIVEYCQPDIAAPKAAIVVVLWHIHAHGCPQHLGTVLGDLPT